jgi:hypothetical protein
MRRLTVPAVLVVVPLALGCSSESPVDASADAVPDLADTGDVSDAMDAALDAMDAALDAMDAPVDAYPEVDIVFSERREVVIPDDAPQPVCEARRNEGGVFCYEENVQGTGLFCIRYRCDADDGGAALSNCCRLVG